MAFTERFISVPLEVVNKKEQEMIGDESATKTMVRAMINPFEVASYREDPGTSDDPTRRTVIEFKSGESMTIEIPIEQFERLLDKF